MGMRRRLRRQFKEAKVQAVQNGLVVCAALKADGTPVYFTAAPDADNETMAKLAYRAVHDRPMSSVEEWIWKQARNRDKKVAAGQ